VYGPPPPRAAGAKAGGGAGRGGGAARAAAELTLQLVIARAPAVAAPPPAAAAPPPPADAAAAAAAAAPAPADAKPPPRAPLFHDENMPSFFRRLAWSPDGSFLAAPAGMQPGRDARAPPRNVTWLFKRRVWGAPAAALPCPPAAGGRAVAVRFCPVLFAHAAAAATDANADAATDADVQKPFAAHAPPASMMEDAAAEARARARHAMPCDAMRCDAMRCRAMRIRSLTNAIPHVSMSCARAGASRGIRLRLRTLRTRRCRRFSRRRRAPAAAGGGARVRAAVPDNLRSRHA
jgi:hypothetical protein